MATRDTEGRREIEAAKQRLASAKSHEKFISKSLQSAKVVEDAARKAREDIQLQAISSKQEVEDTQKFLAEAEARWEVIDVDADEEGIPTQNEVSNKKRKVSLSPQGNNSNVNSTDNTTQSSQLDNTDSGGSTTALSRARELLARRGYVSNNAVSAAASGTSAASTSSNNNIDRIIVEACTNTMSQCNGTYKRSVDIYYRDAHVYIKDCSTMAIFRYYFRVPDRTAWCIGQWLNEGSSGGCPGMIYYRDASDNSSQSIAPPGNDWEPVGGIYPLPTCRLIANNQSNLSNNGPVSTSASAAASNQSAQTAPNNVDQIVVEGCVLPEFNGTYKREIGSLHNDHALYLKQQEGFSRDSSAIYRNVKGRWVIGKWHGVYNVGGGHPGMLCYYTSETNFTAPPENNWQSVMGCDQPAPTCRLVTNNNHQNGNGTSSVSAHEQYFRREQQLIQRQYQINAAAAANRSAQQIPIPNEIDVVGAAIQSINGTYKRDEDEDRNGHPTYYKLGTLDGVLKEFIIYRAEGNNRFWYIGIPDENWKFYMVRCDFSPDKRLPPKSDWVISIHGQSPSPNLQY